MRASLPKSEQHVLLALLLIYGVARVLALVVYAALGLDSLGHYVLAPPSAHTVAMNATIIAEVTAAGCVLFEVVRQIGRRVAARMQEHDA